MASIQDQPHGGSLFESSSIGKKSSFHFDNSFFSKIFCNNNENYIFTTLSHYCSKLKRGLSISFRQRGRFLTWSTRFAVPAHTFLTLKLSCSLERKGMYSCGYTEEPFYAVMYAGSMDDDTRYHRLLHNLSLAFKSRSTLLVDYCLNHLNRTSCCM